MLKHNNILMHIVVTLTLFFSLQSLAIGKTIKVMDTGLDMLRETVELPDGWKIDADIVSDAMTGQYVRFKHDVIGLNDEMLRELPPVLYGILTGRSFQKTWMFIIDQAVSDFMDIESTGRLIENGPITKRTLKARNVNLEQFAASGKKIFEVTVTGEKNSRPYSAVLVFSVQPFDGQSGMMIGGIVGSPTKRLDATIDTSFKLSKKTKMNPQYDTRRSRLIDQQTQVLAIQHNQRMRNNQQQFNQQQQMMRDRSQAFDQQNQQWMNNFTKSTPNYGQNGYSGQEAYIDSIHETSTFADPSTGQNRTVDGQYKYNYTDGMGGYYGTDDPSFNPYSMPDGDWQETQQLQPGY